MTKISYGPLWKEKTSGRMLGVCYILSTTIPKRETGGLKGGGGGG